MNLKTSVRNIKARKSILIPMSIIFLAIIIMGIFEPQNLYNIQNKIVTIAFNNFGWLFQVTAVMFTCICIWLTMSKYGNIKLGGSDAKPILSYWNWFTISLTSGIGTGILFWGIAEPVTHFINPPQIGGTIKSGSEAAAMLAMNISFTHWTFIPYAMYAISGVSIAFAVFNMKLPCRVSSVLYILRNKPVNKFIESMIDNICLFAIAGGVAAVLGVGTIQISTGLNLILGTPNTKLTWIIVVFIIVITYIVSSITGLDKGIKWIADKNTKLYIGLLIFIFIFGPTTFILSLGTQSIGYSLDHLFSVSTYLSPIDGSEWSRWWPIYYWAIWLAYSPLMGMFFAIISKGRTIKEFMIMNFIIPSIFGVFWFIIFGGASIHQQISGTGLWQTMQSVGTEAALFAFIKNYPFYAITSLFFIIAIFISIVTMCDTMTTTISTLSTDTKEADEKNVPSRIKMFWGISMAFIAIINLISSGDTISGIDSTKQLATVAGFPILFFMLILAFCGIKMIINNPKYDLTNCNEIEDKKLQ